MGLNRFNNLPNNLKNSYPNNIEGSAQPPNAPSSLATSLNTRYKIHLAWTDNSGGSAGFKIERKDSGAYSQVGTTLAGVTTFNDTIDTANVTVPYTYRVRAYIGTLNSTYSNESSFTLNYRYGYSAGTTPVNIGPIEPNVKAHFLFDQSSGDLVDTVSSITLAAFTGGDGTITYNQTISGIYANLSPGIKLDYSFDGSRANFNKTSATSSLDVGASDHMVVEWWLHPTSFGPGACYFWTYMANGASTDFGILCFAVTDTSIRTLIKGEGSGGADADFTINVDSLTAPTDPVKFRFKFDRTTKLATLYQNGVSKGTGDISGFDTKTLTNTGFGIGFQLNNGAATLPATWYEFRTSIGTDVLNNNSGGPGGG